ncbi:hypothetical protein [Mycolicibacterium wolinskyi]
MSDKTQREYEIRKRTDAVIPNISAGKPQGKGPEPVDKKARTPNRA